MSNYIQNRPDNLEQCQSTASRQKDLPFHYMNEEGGIKKSIVYVVDDDQDDRLLSYCSLKKSERVQEVRPVKCAGALFQCFENSGLYQSVSFAEYHAPVILLDLHMPVTDGLEVLAKIRYHPITSEFPVILLTGDQSGERVYDAYQLQANGYLQKPFEIEQFHNVLDQASKGLLKIKFGVENQER